MPTIIRRGRVNSSGGLTLNLDQSLIDAVIAPHIDDTENPHGVTAAQIGVVASLREEAVVACHAHTLRAFIGDAWHWHGRTLGRVLLLSSLRG